MLIDWSKSTFGNIKENKLKILVEIDHLDKLVGVNGVIDLVSASRNNSLLGDLEVILWEEKIHWKQKAKCKWLKERDNNTKFFHKVACGKN